MASRLDSASEQGHNTRNANRLRLPRIRTEAGRRQLLYSGVSDFWVQRIHAPLQWSSGIQNRRETLLAGAWFKLNDRFVCMCVLVLELCVSDLLCQLFLTFDVALMKSCNSGFNVNTTNLTPEVLDRSLVLFLSSIWILTLALFWLPGSIIVHVPEPFLLLLLSPCFCDFSSGAFQCVAPTVLPLHPYISSKK